MEGPFLQSRANEQPAEKGGSKHVLSTCDVHVGLGHSTWSLPFWHRPRMILIISDPNTADSSLLCANHNSRLWSESMQSDGAGAPWPGAWGWAGFHQGPA